MFARVSKFEGPPENMDEMINHAREQVLPGIRQQRGFKGLIALGDHASGKTIGLTFWESEEAMRASEEEADRLRSESAEAGNETIEGVERYEVEIFEIQD